MDFTELERVRQVEADIMELGSYDPPARIDVRDTPVPASAGTPEVGVRIYRPADGKGLEVDPDRIAVAGESSGGGLAAAVALYARDHGGPALSVQYLGVPVLDDRLDTLASQFDPVRDEDLAYAQRLVAAGVPTEVHLFSGTFHGSTQLAPQAR